MAVLHSPTTYLDGPPRRLLDPLCNLLVDTRVALALRTAIVKAGAIDALMRVVVSSNSDYSVALRLHDLLGSPIMAQYAPLSVEAPDATVAEMRDEVQRSMDGLPRLGEHWVGAGGGCAIKVGSPPRHRNVGARAEHV